MATIPISNIGELYDEINKPANMGNTLLLNAGTYVLDPNQLHGGRLELQADMSIMGVNGDPTKVIIDTSRLMPQSFTLQTGRTGAIRMGEGGHNELSWVTVNNQNATNGIRSLVQADLGTAPTSITIGNCILRDSDIGIAVINWLSQNRQLKAHIHDNLVVNNAADKFKAGMMIQNRDVTNCRVEIYSERNTLAQNGIGIAAFNAGGPNNEIYFISRSDIIVSNGLGLQLMGGLNGLNSHTENNRTIFNAESTVIINNGNQVTPSPPGDFNRMGIFAAAGKINSSITAGNVRNNMLIATFTNCTLDISENLSLETFGKVLASQDQSQLMFSGNVALVHLRASGIGSFRSLHSNSDNDGTNTASVLIEKELPVRVNENVFDHLPDLKNSIPMGNPAVLKLGNSISFPVWRGTLPEIYDPYDIDIPMKIHNRNYIPLVEDEYFNALGDPFAILYRGAHPVIAYKNKSGHVLTTRLGTGDEEYWMAEDLSKIAVSPPAHGDPVGYINHVIMVNHVFYRDMQGNLYVLFWKGEDPVKYESLTYTISAPVAAGDPAAYYDQSGTNLVIYRSNTGEILGLSWLGGATNLDHLSSVAGSPNAISTTAGDPSAYHIPIGKRPEFNDFNQLVYLAADHHIYEIYWQGNNRAQTWKITESKGILGPESRLASYYYKEANTKHIIYRKADRLFEIWWEMGTTDIYVIDLTETYYLPAATGNPNAYIMDGKYPQHILYRGVDRHIYEVIYNIHDIGNSIMQKA